MNEGRSISEKAKLGVVGLDDILIGGLRRNRLFLFEGIPGAGKTTLALQFLLEGARNQEKGLYITLSETEAELRETSYRSRMVVRQQHRYFRTGAARESAR
jgi:circadian clock protein KaiC